MNFGCRVTSENELPSFHENDSTVPYAVEKVPTSPTCYCCLKEIRHGIFSYFGHVEENLKIIIFYDRKTPKEQEWLRVEKIDPDYKRRT